MAESMYYRKPWGQDPLDVRDAILGHLYAVDPALIKIAAGWPAVQASRTENFDAFVADEVMVGVIKWLRALADATEREVVKDFLRSQAETAWSKLVERGLIEI